MWCSGSALFFIKQTKPSSVDFLVHCMSTFVKGLQHAQLLHYLIIIV